MVVCGLKRNKNEKRRMETVRPLKSWNTGKKRACEQQQCMLLKTEGLQVRFYVYVGLFAGNAAASCNSRRIEDEIK